MINCLLMKWNSSRNLWEMIILYWMKFLVRRSNPTNLSKMSPIPFQGRRLATTCKPNQTTAGPLREVATEKYSENPLKKRRLQSRFMNRETFKITHQMFQHHQLSNKVDLHLKPKELKNLILLSLQKIWNFKRC